MGIISGAMGGLGDAMQALGMQNIRDQNAMNMEDKREQSAMDLTKMQADIATQREEAMAEFKVNLENSQRQAQVSRVGQAKQDMVADAIGKKYGESDAAVAAADAGETDAPLTDDQRAVINQAKQSDTDALMNSPNITTQAAIKTGDISPKEAADLASRADMASAKAENYQNRTEMMKELAQIRADATIQAMGLRLDAAKEKAANGKIDAATGRMLITSEDANIKAATSQMNLISRQLEFARKEEKPGLLAQIDQLKDDIKTSQTTKNMYMKQLGFPTSDDAKTSPRGAQGTASPSSNPVPSLPTGAVQIGTSGGKPVYQTPDGKRFIQQ